MGDKKWNGNGDNISWGDPDNWEGGVPGEDDNAFLEGARVEAGGAICVKELNVSGTWMNVEQVYVERIAIQGQCLFQTASSIIVSKEALWLGGGSVHNLRIRPGATLRVEGFETRELYGCLVNDGTVLWRCLGTLTHSNFDIENKGTFRVEVPGGTLQGFTDFVNTGTLELAMSFGTFTLDYDSHGLVSTGQINLGGATLVLAHGEHRFENSRITGHGVVEVSSQTEQEIGALECRGKVRLAEGITLRITRQGSLWNETQEPAVLEGGRIDWEGGSLNGPITIGKDCSLHIQGASPKRLLGGPLINEHLMVWDSEGALTVCNNDPFVNRNVFRIDRAGRIEGSPEMQITNLGTLNCDRPDIEFTLDGVHLESHGKLNVNLAKLKVKNAGVILGAGSETLVDLQASGENYKNGTLIADRIQLDGTLKAGRKAVPAEDQWFKLIEYEQRKGTFKKIINPDNAGRILFYDRNVAVWDTQPALIKYLAHRIRNTRDTQWPHLDRAKVANNLQTILNEPSQIWQGELGLCGPAAFLWCWCRRDPLAVAAFALELYEQGRSTMGKDHMVEPDSDLLDTDYDKIKWKNDKACPAAGWMLMSTLQDSANSVWDYEGTPGEDRAEGAEPPIVVGWLEASGIYGSVMDKTFDDPVDDINQSLATAQRFGPSNTRDVIMRIDIRLIEPQEKAGRHYIGLISPIEVTDQNQIKFQYFSWGEVGTANISFEHFKSYYLGLIVAELP